MKGVIFTEFLTMVEEAFDLDMVDTIIASCDLPSGGSYTAVGTYDHTEIVDLVVSLSKESGTPVPDLLTAYGSYLFGSLARLYPQFINDSCDPLEFLEQVETYIHVEVRKLYPEAELPTFVSSRPDGPNILHLIYESGRHLEDVCHGLISGCLDHFKASHKIDRETLPDKRELFIITIQ
jgi:hypothetical protein